MKIDMHIHCSERSSCSIATEQQHIQAAIKYGLDAIVITDHNKFVPQKHLEELNSKYYPFKIFCGIEIRTIPNGDDVLVIGIKDKLLEEKKWTYESLYRFTKEHGGFIALCHPYRYGSTVNIDIATYVPDAIEIHSTNIGRCDEKLIKALADRLGSKLIGNSDGHNHQHTGIYYNIIDSNPQTEEELAVVLLRDKILIGKDEIRIKDFNEKVCEREKMIRRMIDSGKTAEDYNLLTGNWVGEFERVLLNKSYEI